MRAAVYFTPAHDAPLTEAAASWLGRDAFTGLATRARDPSLDPAVAEPARYGFHATMRAPFRLSGSRTLDEAEAALGAFCATRRRFVLPSMALARHGRWLTYVPTAPSADLAALEADLLEAMEPFRAPLTPAERARRRPETLSPHRLELLERWGYPDVLDAFRFHMTLAGPIEDEAEAAAVEARLRAGLGAFDGAPLAIDRLALFVEPGPGEPFRVRSVHTFPTP